MNAAWQQRTRLTCCNAHLSHTLHLGRPSRVQRYSSSMHRAMEEDSLMIRHDDDDHIPHTLILCCTPRLLLTLSTCILQLGISSASLFRYSHIPLKRCYKIIYLYHTHINIWYTCNKTGKTQNTIRILK